MHLRAEQCKKATSALSAQLASCLVTGNVPRRVMDEACICGLPEVCSARGYLSGFVSPLTLHHPRLVSAFFSQHTLRLQCSFPPSPVLSGLLTNASHCQWRTFQTVVFMPDPSFSPPRCEGLNTVGNILNAFPCCPYFYLSRVLVSTSKALK